MTSESNNPQRAPIGQLWLRQHFGLRTTKPFVVSYVTTGARRTETHGPHVVEYYPRHYAANLDGPIAHLRFALRHEPTDLRVLVAALRVLGPEALTEWVRKEPTGSFSRRAWFLYETFLEERLPLTDARVGNYVDALDPAKHIVGKRRNSPRHRVIDNLLGTRELCPTVRRTPRLIEQANMHVDEEARELLESYDPATLARAVNYLYSKETKSSFAIEGETPSANRTERFVAALKSADRFDPANHAQLIGLQNKIVESRYAATSWRSIQNFIGSVTAGYREQVHFICPKPADVPGLMRGWSQLTLRSSAEIDPVAAAAISSFAFVFIHPFEDGNGRIHRFLMHHVLAKTGFSPPGVIFPVSAAIVRDQRAYDDVLEGFSAPLFKYIEWHMEDATLAVENETSDFYRYFDATPFAEYLYDRVVDTVRTDLKNELNFIEVFDAALDSVRAVVDMPDRKVSLFVRLCMQNGGRLSARKRDDFEELTDQEIAAMEQGIAKAIAAVEARRSDSSHAFFDV